MAQITLRETHAAHDAAAKSTLKEVFELTNKRAAVVLNDVNYWTFGGLQEDSARPGPPRS